MEREISDVAKLGIVLIALAVVISLGLGAFTVVKSTANECSADLTNTLQMVENSKVMDYNGVTIKGSQLRNFINTNIQIVEVGVLVEVKDADSKLSERGYSIKIKDKFYTNWGRVIRPNDTEPIISEIGDSVDKNPTLLELENNTLNGYFHTNNAGAIRKVSNGYETQGSSEFIPNKTKYIGQVVTDAAGEYIGIIFDIVE